VGAGLVWPGGGFDLQGGLAGFGVMIASSEAGTTVAVAGASRTAIMTRHPAADKITTRAPT
jgi:hypothetical protein